GDDGQTHTLRRIDDVEVVKTLRNAFEHETLYIADGHHRYETALAYRDERRRAASDWTGDEPGNFALVALASAADPGLLAMPSPPARPLRRLALPRLRDRQPRHPPAHPWP